MIDQPSLFDEPRTFREPDLLPGESARRLAKARKEHLSDLYRMDAPQTSVTAAKSVLPKLKGRKLEILECLGKYPDGLMVWQICEITGREKPSISPRMSWLVKEGFITECGVGISNNGLEATIYKLST